jgi:hypothetical protein
MPGTLWLDSARFSSPCGPSAAMADRSGFRAAFLTAACACRRWKRFGGSVSVESGSSAWPTGVTLRRPERSTEALTVLARTVVGTAGASLLRI